jgi:photosystem II stability/assembly factor-like uncharacterized protein
MRLISCCIALLLLLAGPASAQWTVEYQRGNSDTYNAIVFPSSTVGYMVGGSGMIMKTTDGGSTWAQQTSNTTATLNGVFFKSATEGWAVGASGTIISTTDGGTNWNVHAQSGVLTTSTFNDVYFVGNSGWAGNDDDNLYYTTDNGVTWVLSGTFTDDVNSVSFADANNGYVALDGAGIAYSTDGGANWSAASVNLGPYPYTRTDIERIFTIDDTTAVATGWGSMVGYQPTILIVSTDAGATWNVPNASYPWNTYAYGYGISMFDDGEVIIVGGGSGFAAPNIHSGATYADWARVKEFTGDGLNACAVVPGTNTVFAVGDDGTIAKSDDKGYTWDFLYTASFGFRGILRFTHNGTTTFAVGGNGLFMKKVGDSDWTAPVVLSPNGYAPNLQDIFYIDGVLYASAGYDFLAKSTDDGDTWTEMYTVTALADGIYGMHWFDADNGILVGELGGDDVIYTTDDGGVTRTTIWHNVWGQQFNDVNFAPGQSKFGVIGADNIAFFRTVNGGLNWTQGTEDIASTTNDIEKVFMVDGLTAWAVGDNGTIAKSVDGGANWLEQPSWTTTVELMDVFFNTLNGHGYIAGYDQTARESVDGGVTWTDMAPVLETPSDDIYSIYLNSSTNKLYIGCYQAMIQYWDNSPTGDTPMSLPFVLNQNYPNPFNPSTTISFSLDRDGFVSLNVYDVAGRVVATILNKEMSAGSYDVGFNAKGLSSGVYFYKLRTADQEMTRKMILLR